YMTTVNMVTAVEAMVLGVKAGLNPKTIWEVVKVSTGNSSSFERRAPYMFNRKFEPEGRLLLGHKDLEAIRNWANSLGVPAFMASVAQQVHQLGISAGLSEMDSAALVIALERIAGVEVKA
ncbi:MAG: NAD-binding protein, partial [Chloroflexi bacterium]|nr:NAD-binding protein [Chloroflexota bacterium]